MKKMFILYDERANYDHTENAAVLDTAETLDEAKDVRENLFPNAVIFEYDVKRGELINERRVV